MRPRTFDSSSKRELSTSAAVRWPSLFASMVGTRDKTSPRAKASLPITLAPFAVYSPVESPIAWASARSETSVTANNVKRNANVASAPRAKECPCLLPMSSLRMGKEARCIDGRDSGICGEKRDMRA
jgi:hypothetical protein